MVREIIADGQRYPTAVLPLIAEGHRWPIVGAYSHAAIHGGVSLALIVGRAIQIGGSGSSIAAVPYRGPDIRGARAHSMGVTPECLVTGTARKRSG